MGISHKNFFEELLKIHLFICINKLNFSIIIIQLYTFYRKKNNFLFYTLIIGDSKLERFVTFCDEQNK